MEVGSTMRVEGEVAGGTDEEGRVVEALGATGAAVLGLGESARGGEASVAIDGHGGHGLGWWKV